jgi:hypothetical protein
MLEGGLAPASAGRAQSKGDQGVGREPGAGNPDAARLAIRHNRARPGTCGILPRGILRGVSISAAEGIFPKAAVFTMRRGVSLR